MFSFINGPSTCERLALDTASMYFGVEEALDTKPPLRVQILLFPFVLSVVPLRYSILAFSFPYFAGSHVLTLLCTVVYLQL